MGKIPNSIFNPFSNICIPKENAHSDNYKKRIAKYFKKNWFINILFRINKSFIKEEFNVDLKIFALLGVNDKKKFEPTNEIVKENLNEIDNEVVVSRVIEVFDGEILR